MTYNVLSTEFSFEIPDFCRVIVDESEARIHFHAIEIEKE